MSEKLANRMRAFIKQRKEERTTLNKEAMHKAAMYDRFQEVRGMVGKMVDNRSIGPDKILSTIDNLMSPSTDLKLASVRMEEDYSLEEFFPDSGGHTKVASRSNKDSNWFDRAIVSLSGGGSMSIPDGEGW